MTVVMETTRPPMGGQDELAGALNTLLKEYLDLLAEERGTPWSKHEEDLVRMVRDVLTRAGYPPNLSYETTAHLDYPMFTGTR